MVAIIFLLGVEIHLLKRSSRRAKILKERDKLCPSSPDGTLKKGLSASYNPAFERDSVFINGLGGMQSEQNLAGAGSQAQLCIVEQDENWDETMPHRTSLFLRIGTAGRKSCTFQSQQLTVKLIDLFKPFIELRNSKLRDSILTTVVFNQQSIFTHESVRKSVNCKSL